MADDADAVRLSKRVAALAGCSRREAEQYIEGGFVQVDGATVLEPQARVTGRQQVTLAADARLQALAPITVLLHKPAGHTLEAALAGMGLQRAQLRHQHALMPLPPEASGLCVFSQDRRVIRKLTEEAAWVEQELVAEVTGELAPDGLQRLGRRLKASWQSERRLRLAFKGLEVAQVPGLCAEVGLAVTGLRRIRLGRIPMAGLASGQWRQLQAHERF